MLSALSIHAGENPILHPCLILGPLFGAVFFGAVPIVIKLTVEKQRDDEDKVRPNPGIGEVAEDQGNRQGKEPLAQVVEVAGDTPETTAQDLAVTGLDVLGFDQPEELAVGPPLEGVFLQVGAARDAPPEQEQRSRSDEPDIRPCRRESGVRLSGHAPQREDEQPPVDHEATPEQLEAEILMDQIVGVELDALEDEVVQYVGCEECRIQENAWI